MAFDWKNTLGAVAPTLATALGGPMAGAAVRVLATQFLGNEGATQSDVAEAIASASPEQLAKLKEIDADFQKDMAQIGVNLEQIAADDRKSARDLAKTNMAPQIWLSTLYTLGYIVVLWAFMGGSVEISETVKSEFNMVLGVITTVQVQILNFWFGSSSGSKDKTARLSA